ncbi:MAG: Uncharacterized protein XD60_1448 [Acetothermia bacterium 64_32]|nr:MAG: Uncharacterized protein XD60_1448 [Acetothermia bacterium 64_32]HAF71358.1 hypothetical protein [Candidatus Acetothermia bacterium]
MIRAGLQRVNITPPIGTPLGGYAARKSVSQGIHDDLYATALVLQGEEVTLALVTADLVGLPQELVEKLRVAVRSSTGIPPDNVLVAATHTHSGPDLLFGDQGLASEAYVEVLADTLAGSVYAAWCSLQPAEVEVGQGWIEGIGVNRRTPAGTPVDPQVGVLRVDHEGRPRGVLVNYTCHPVVLGPDNLLITADFPGYMVRVLEWVFGEGFTAMFTNGAAGDINTGHSAELSALGEKIPGRTFERAEKLGTMLAGEVLKVLETIEPCSNIPIAAMTKEISLPLKPLPSLKEAEASAKQKEQALTELIQRKAPSELVTKARIEKLYADLLLKQVHERSQRPHDGVKHVELQAIRIGDCALLAFPGELFVEIGLEIKAKSPFRYTYIVGYANGYVGYVPTKQAFEEGGYEAVTAQFAPETSDIVIEESLALLNSLA